MIILYIYIERERWNDKVYMVVSEKKKQGEMETSANVTGLEKHLSIDIN